MTLDGYSKATTVEAVLVEAGLEHLLEGFQDVDIESFRRLMIQDYESYGVHDVEDKQALFKVVKDLDTYVGSSMPKQIQQAQVVHSSWKDSKDILHSGPLTKEDRRMNHVSIVQEEKNKGFDDLVDLSVDPSFLLDGGDLGIDSVVTGDGNCLKDLVPTLSSHSEDDEIMPDESTKNCFQKGPPFGHSDASAESSIFQAVDPPRIRVIVRKRPLNKKEQEKGEIDVIQCDPESASLSVHEPKTKVDMTKYIETHQFCFDDVFDDDVDNDSLYIQAVRPLIATALKSGRGTCFAYGQTGSGKTYTMQPLPLRAASDIFHISATMPSFSLARLYVSCYEIYGGKIFDLLNSRQRLEVREDAKRRIQVVGLKEIEVSALSGLARLCEHAACSRSTGSTGANDESSRSHSIMTFTIRSPKEEDILAEPTRLKKGNNHDGAMKTVGKLSFIDLAGSERGADTYENDKQTRIEGAEINKSLLALKECIRALDMDAGHVPFRGSKLTSVLRDSFIGKNARTVMIANISPSSSSCEHTLNTLRYADRVKEMKKESVGRSQRKSSVLLPDDVSRVLMGLPAPQVLGTSSEHVSNKESSTTQHGGVKSALAALSAKEEQNILDPVFSNMGYREDARQTASHQLEDELAYLHRQQIEDTMIILRQEMDLLAKLDSHNPESISMQEYVEELEAILTMKLKGLSFLQERINAYKIQ